MMNNFLLSGTTAQVSPSSTPKIGVIGYKGRLGSIFTDIYGLDSINCDITSVASLTKVLDDANYDVIINCAAYTDVDGAEQDRIRAYSINTFGPQNLAKTFGGKIVHISSDYIFSGEDGPYDEEAVAQPLSAYGFSKYMGEVGLRPYMDRVLIVRTTVLYDAQPNNFIRSVYEQLKNNRPVKVPKNIIGNPTHVEHLAYGIMHCIRNEYTGIINIVGKTRMSRYDTAFEVGRMFGLDTTQIYDSPAWGEAHRPEKAGLTIDKARKLGVPLYSLWEGLHQLKIDLETPKVEKNKVIMLGIKENAS